MSKDHEYLYPYSAQEAKKRNQLPMWRESYHANVACRNAIEETIRQNFDGMNLKKDCLEPVLAEYGYVACCGTSIQPVLQMLEQVPQLDTVLLCLDNDEAGNQASRRMQNQLEVRYSVERLIPESKDWNDDLTLSSENAQGLAMNEMR